MRLTPEERDKLSKREWSYSSLSKFKQCPFSFYDTYVLGRRYDIPEARFGKAFHFWVDSYLKGFRGDYSFLFEAHSIPPEKQPTFRDCVESFIDFRVHELGRNKIQAEETIKFEHEGFKFTATADLIVHTREGKVRLYDTKTSQNSKYYKEYSDQIKLYDWALQNFCKYQVEKRYLFFPREEPSKRLIEMEGHNSNTMVEFLLLISRILESDFPTCPNKFCSNCNIFKEKRCPAFKSPLEE